PRPSPVPEPVPSPGDPPSVRRRRFRPGSSPIAPTSGNIASKSRSNRGRSPSSFTSAAASASRRTPRSTPAAATAATASSVSAPDTSTPPPRSAWTNSRMRVRIPAHASGSGVEERDDARQPGYEREERVDRREHDHRLVGERLLREPAEDHQEPARLRL